MQLEGYYYWIKAMEQMGLLMKDLDRLMKELVARINGICVPEGLDALEVPNFD